MVSVMSMMSFFIEEAGLDVDLGEFRLAVGTQVFVTEALGVW